MSTIIQKRIPVKKNHVKAIENQMQETDTVIACC